MVSNGSHNVNRLSKTSSISGQSSGGNSKCGPIKHANITESGRMAHFRGSLSDKEKGVEDLLSTSWRKGIHKNYDSAWRKWELWCISNHVSPISVSLIDVLAFLAAQFHAGHGYHSLNVYRSAISSIHPMIVKWQPPIGISPPQGYFNKRLPLPKYKSTWSVESVITYVSSMGPNKSA